MSKGIGEIIAGAALIAVDVAFLGANPALIMAGAGLIAGGIGTLLTKQQQGLSANSMNPIMPWNVVYGQAKIGGTCIYLEETGQSDKYLHLIYVLACHPCQAINAVLFDNKRVCLDTSGNSLSFGGSTAVQANQQTVNIASIVRQNDVVTVTMANAMPLPASTAAGPALVTGDTVQIQNVSGDHTLNGQFVVQLVSPTVFTYICGGNPIALSGQGSVKTQWPDYGDTVHAEFALGAQSQTSPPFPGLLAAGDTGSNGLWTSSCVIQGRTAAYLRLKYGGNTYANGMPNIAFVVSGKNDIYDPRTGGRGYTTNGALCIADFLCEPTWGFKCVYGTEVPANQLTSAANICDETVPLANGGTESRYTCNGSFQLNAKRGEILQNLLTCCGGRLTYSGGQYVINPAAWTGSAVQLGYAFTNAAGSPIASATLYATTAHVAGNPTTGGVLAQALPANPISLFSPRSWMGGIFQTAPWGTRTDSYSIPANQLSQFAMAFGIGPASAATDTSPEQLLVYDCWIGVTFADGTGTTYRPTVASVNTTWNQGTVTNPGAAIDGDPTTYALISRAGFDTLDFSQLLILSNFNFPTISATSSNTAFPAYAAGPFQWKPKVAVRDLYNGVKGTYVCPANNWQASDMPPYAQDTEHGYPGAAGTTGYYDINMAADGGERRWYDMQFPFTISSATAQRLAKIELLRRRQQGTGTFVYNLAMYQLTALDIISMTMPFLGWTNKLLEVTAHRFTVQKHDDQNKIALGTELDVQETDPSIYDWSPAEELTAEGFRQPGLAPPVVAAPIAAASTTGPTVAKQNADGTTSSSVQISWSPPSDAYVAQGGQVIVEYQVAGSSTWQTIANIDPSATSAYIPNVSEGQQYTARVAYMSAQGVQSAWTVLPTVTAYGGTGNVFADAEVPAGVQDGVNTGFTLAHIPFPTTSLQLKFNGVDQIEGTNINVVGNAITFLPGAPVPNASQGDTLEAWYRYSLASAPPPTVFAISGTVTDRIGGQPLSGVAITVGTSTVTTDASGNYSVPGLPAGTYTVTPTDGTLSFYPASQSVSVVAADVVAVSFYEIYPNG